MKKLFLLLALAFAPLVIGAQEANLRYSLIPSEYKKTLIINAISPSKIPPFDYKKVAEYPKGQGFLLHLQVYQIDEIEGGWEYWTLDKSKGPGNIVIILSKIKNPFVRINEWTHFFCLYRGNTDVTLTQPNTGKQRETTVPVFYSDLFGIAVKYNE
jgi:hypothetical protein